ncbi:MAG: hypothetical protein PF636_10135 [Actinomycetota bacterium]|jgi:hypothetical protein|nr:hypothetical protein [Actinomycetota bacterium]
MFFPGVKDAALVLAFPIEATDGSGRVTAPTGLTVIAGKWNGAVKPEETSPIADTPTLVGSLWYLLVTAEENTHDRMAIDIVCDEGTQVLEIVNNLDAFKASGFAIAEEEGDTLINHLTKLDGDGSIDPAGTAIGVATAGSSLMLFLATDTSFATAKRRTTAASDGTWSLHVAPGTWTLRVTLDDHYDAADGDSAITRTIIIE